MSGVVDSNVTAWRNTEVFKTVCVDAAYYTFPASSIWGHGLPGTGRLPVWLEGHRRHHDQEVPKLDRFAEQAGKANENFLNAICSRRRS